MDWDKLKVFHAAAEAGSFTHAGEQLGLSQSAVSRQVSALEQELSVSLFHRHARRQLRLLADAFTLLAPDAPFVQFTYAGVSPIPRAYSGARAQASESIWFNLPPARVWIYRKA